MVACKANQTKSNIWQPRNKAQHLINDSYKPCFSTQQTPLYVHKSFSVKGGLVGLTRKFNPAIGILMNRSNHRLPSYNAMWTLYQSWSKHTFPQHIVYCKRLWLGYWSSYMRTSKASRGIADWYLICNGRTFFIVRYLICLLFVAQWYGCI